MPISVEVRGGYHELAQFISDVAALPRIVTFGDITISSSSSKDNKLTMSAKAKTYRYMEEGGIKQQVKPVPRKISP
jgi:type IV pilus assembly protein PilO